MNIKVLIFLLSSSISSLSVAQSAQQINQTDREGHKQGHWIKKYPSGKTMYDGFFRNDKPQGEFKRYYENGEIKSVMVFSADGSTSEATIYYDNGFPASKGTYVNQLKEGTWKYFSPTSKGVKVLQEDYTKDKRNGASVEFYPDSTIAEKISYKGGRKEGAWTKYNQEGKISFSANCSNDRLNGKYEGFFDNGKTEITGNYKDDLRDGLWIMYTRDGKVRFKIEYVLGMPQNRDLDIYETNLLDSLEKVKITIPDPEKTGQPW